MKKGTEGAQKEINLVEVHITVGFHKEQTVYWKRGKGSTLSEAVTDLFSKKGNHIKKEEMVLVYKELLKTKAKEFRQ